jgi:transposase
MARDGLVPMTPLFVAMASTWPISPQPERGLLCILLMALYGIRSEAQFRQELEGSPLFRWFLDITATEVSDLDPVLLAQMRTRLLRNGAATEFFERLIADAAGAGLLANEHFSPDPQQVAVWSARSARPVAPGLPA